MATFSVSSGGSNASNGSSATPWQTLQYAADRVQAGDTVIVRAGTYVGFDLRTDGTAANRISFSAEQGVLINQRNIRTTDGINLEGADYVTIEGFNVSGIARAGIRSVLNHHVIIRNNQAHQNGRWGIFTGFSDGRSRLIQAADYLVQTENFRTVRAYGGGGIDTASLQDLLSSHTISGRANWFRLANADSVTGYDFEQVTAAARAGQRPRVDVTAIDYIFTKVGF